MSSSSRNTSSSTTGRARAPTPFCKVCRDAGRPESEYTSHFVKDQPGKDGKVVCPMLLNQACRICEKPGHTSSYCPQYRPRREERYIEREQPRREERYIEREQPRREERYIEREQPRREERYIEREQPRRDISFNRLHDDTERRDQEIRDRDDSYRREQDRRAKPWLQAALKPASASRNAPYAHPHGPRVRLNLESTALCASKHAVAEEALPAVVAEEALPSVDMRKVQLNHASNWGDEPFRVFDPKQMANEFLENILILSNLATDAEHDFIAECDDQSQMPFNCGQ